MHQGGGKHILSSVDPSNLAAWWLHSPVSLWWAQDGSVWAPFPKGCSMCLLSSSSPREKQELQPCFPEGFNFRKRGFFPFFSVLICYRWHFLTTVPKFKGSEWNLFRKMMLVTTWLCSWDLEKISNKICVGFLCSWLYLGAVSEKHNYSMFQSSAAKWQYQRQDLKTSLKINSRQALAWDGDGNGSGGSPICPFPNLPAISRDTIARSSTHPQNMFLLFLFEVFHLISHVCICLTAERMSKERAVAGTLWYFLCYSSEITEAHKPFQWECMWDSVRIIESEDGVGWKEP